MEVVCAIGLVANMIQFVTLGSNILKAAKEIQQSMVGLTKDNEELKITTTEMRSLTQRLYNSSIQLESEKERAVHELARKCGNLSERILNLIQTVSLEDRVSKWYVLKSSYRQVFKSTTFQERKELETRLANCTTQLGLHLQELLQFMSSFSRWVSLLMIL